MTTSKEKKEIEQLRENMELLEWFEKHCVAARHIDKEENLTTKGNQWQVLVRTRPDTSLTFGSETLLEAIENARGVCKE